MKKPAKKTTTPAETQTIVENSYITDLTGAYALVIRNDNEVQMVSPTLEEGAPLTDGHLLLLGMIMLLNQPGWAQSVVEATAKRLSEAQDTQTGTDTQTEG
jgi:hypothetical protein